MTDTTGLEALGYSPRWQALYRPYAAEGLRLARVIRSDRGSVLAATAEGLLRAKPSARLLKAAKGPEDLPAAGDWVAVQTRDDLDVSLIEAVLDRASAIARGGAGKSSDSQVLAANVDTVFIVHPIAEAPNLRRIERELSLAWDSGATPVIVLAKSDLSDDADAALESIATVAMGVDVLVTSSLTGDGVRPLLDYVSDHRTAVLVGPSGAGKSTLVNALLGEERQATREVRVSDGRGRHTTVSRELIQMPGGGILIDTPGLRSLGLTGSEEGVTSAFPEIEEVARSCRFSDCTHGEEPGCAVRAAIESGAIAEERLASYHKLLREAQVAAIKTDARLKTEHDKNAKVIAKASKRFFQDEGRR